jgi:hypothetical protein
LGDSVPLQQRALYEELSRRFGLPLPPVGPINMDRKRGWTHKQVQNAKLRSLGWSPIYPSFFDAVENDSGLVTGARASSKES